MNGTTIGGTLANAQVYTFDNILCTIENSILNSSYNTNTILMNANSFHAFCFLNGWTKEMVQNFEACLVPLEKQNCNAAFEGMQVRQLTHVDRVFSFDVYQRMTILHKYSRVSIEKQHRIQWYAAIGMNSSYETVVQKLSNAFLNVDFIKNKIKRLVLEDENPVEDVNMFADDTITQQTPQDDKFVTLPIIVCETC